MYVCIYLSYRNAALLGHTVKSALTRRGEGRIRDGGTRGEMEGSEREDLKGPLFKPNMSNNCIVVL